jgi:hypothetical protein
VLRREAAMPIGIGTGRIVFTPWMTSKPDSRGMPNPDFSTAMSCNRLASRITRCSESTSPSAIAVS